MKISKIKNLKLFIFLIGSSFSSYAQSSYTSDALLFNTHTTFGTAKTVSLGGTGVATGADISSTSINPAGLGFFRKSEIVFSPGLYFLNNQTKVDNKTMYYPGNINGLSINNLGIVFNQTKEDFEPGKWRSYSFAFNMNQLANFNNSIGYSNSGTNSYLNKLIAQTNGTPDDNLLNQVYDGYTNLAGIAYGTRLIVPVNPNGDSQYKLLNNAHILGVNSDYSKTTSGNIKSWDFAGGANYDDKLYVGGSVSIMDINYTENINYSEKLTTDSVHTITGFDYSQNRTVSGLGYKIQGGLIFRPVTFLRIGLSASSPTYYNMKESFGNYTFTSYIAPNTYYNNDQSLPVLSTVKQATIPPGSYSYNLNGPSKFSAGVCFSSPNLSRDSSNKINIMITADADIVNYSNIYLKDKNSILTYSNDNFYMNNTFKNALNYRFGSELRVGNLRFRGGYSVYGNPVGESAMQTFSGGIGIKSNDYYIDFTYQNSSFKNSVSISDVAKSTNNLNKFIVTCGIYF